MNVVVFSWVYELQITISLFCALSAERFQFHSMRKKQQDNNIGKKILIDNLWRELLEK